jgi:hypothetical protein
MTPVYLKNHHKSATLVGFVEAPPSCGDGDVFAFVYEYGPPMDFTNPQQAASAKHVRLHLSGGAFANTLIAIHHVTTEEFAAALELWQGIEDQRAEVRVSFLKKQKTIRARNIKRPNASAP